MNFDKFAGRYGLVLEQLLGFDTNVTFRAHHKNVPMPVVVKFYYGKDTSNEFEVLQYLSKLSLPFKIPQPFFSVDVDQPNNQFIYGDHTYQDVYHMIVYEFIEGETVKYLKGLERTRCRNSISAQLRVLHDLGLVYGNIRSSNILHTSDDKYILIDYGMTYSKSGVPFPMTQCEMELKQLDEEPTQERDFEDLYSLIED